MNEYFLHLYSEIPAVFKINDTQIGYIESEQDCIDIASDEKELFLYVYPLENNTNQIFLPFTAKLYLLGNKIHSNSVNLTITDCQTANFRVFVNKPNSIKKFSPALYKTFEDFHFNLVNNTLYIFNQEKHSCIPLDNIFKDFNITQINDFFVLQGEDYNCLQHLLLINSNLELIFVCTANKIEIDSTKIVLMQEIKDIARHALVSVYDIKEGVVSFKEKYTAYIQSSPIMPANIQSLPWAFMEAINVKNFTLARSYLHPLLSQSLKDEHILQFFGDFLEVIYTQDNDYNVLSLVYAGNPQYIKNYKFDLIENKIHNIDCIN